MFDKIKVVRMDDYTIHLVCEGKRLTVSFIDNDRVMINGTQMDSFYIGNEPARPTNDRGIFVKLVPKDRRTD